MDVNSANMNADIRNMPIKITAVGQRGEVGLDIGGISATIIEPKPWLLESGLVYLYNNDNFWEKHLNTRGVKGCTDDPRILDLAEDVKMCWVSSNRVGEVIPPLKGNSSDSKENSTNK